MQVWPCLNSSQLISNFNRPDNNADTESKNYFHFRLRPSFNAKTAERWLWKLKYVYCLIDGRNEPLSTTFVCLIPSPLVLCICSQLIVIDWTKVCVLLCEPTTPFPLTIYWQNILTTHLYIKTFLIARINYLYSGCNIVWCVLRASWFNNLLYSLRAIIHVLILCHSKHLVSLHCVECS